ncbi:hypothetical protein B0H17DRAFT_1186029 [Mycena rosella]|uniref:Uncharacterized protein n=1 Tax=Mycena rosella TaxID=1033263 RepID=A0AAD7CNX1_MYCRO|nr:hypothetical protein B0H17DRAFT_1186029 [Mycena rosella]
MPLPIKHLKAPGTAPLAADAERRVEDVGHLLRAGGGASLGTGPGVEEGEDADTGLNAKKADLQADETHYADNTQYAALQHADADEAGPRRKRPCPLSTLMDGGSPSHVALAHRMPVSSVGRGVGVRVFVPLAPSPTESTMPTARAESSATLVESSSEPLLRRCALPTPAPAPAPAAPSTPLHRHAYACLRALELRARGQPAVVHVRQPAQVALDPDALHAAGQVLEQRLQRRGLLARCDEVVHLEADVVEDPEGEDVDEYEVHPVAHELVGLNVAHDKEVELGVSADVGRTSRTEGSTGGMDNPNPMRRDLAQPREPRHRCAQRAHARGDYPNTGGSSHYQRRPRNDQRLLPLDHNTQTTILSLHYKPSQRKGTLSGTMAAAIDAAMDDAVDALHTSNQAHWHPGGVYAFGIPLRQPPSPPPNRHSRRATARNARLAAARNAQQGIPHCEIKIGRWNCPPRRKREWMQQCQPQDQCWWFYWDVPDAPEGLIHQHFKLHGAWIRPEVCAFCSVKHQEKFDHARCRRSWGVKRVVEHYLWCLNWPVYRYRM